MSGAAQYLDLLKDPAGVIVLLSVIGVLWLMLRRTLGLKSAGRIASRRPLLSLVCPAWSPIAWLAGKMGFKGLSHEMSLIQDEQKIRIAEIRDLAEREGLDNILRVYGAPLPARRTSLASELFVITLVSVMAGGLAGTAGFNLSRDSLLGLLIGSFTTVIIGALLLARLIRRRGAQKTSEAGSWIRTT